MKNDFIFEDMMISQFADMKEKIDALQYDKYHHGTYEDFIVEKVNDLLQMANIQLRIAQNKEEGMKCLDEAIDLLDEMESVYPYVSISEIEALKKQLDHS